MNLRLFVTSAGALILAWLALTFFLEVPVESHLRTSPSSATSPAEDPEGGITAKRDPDKMAARRDVAGK